MPPKRNLDPDLCAALYEEYNSVRKVAEVLEERGIVNPYTNEPFSYRAVAYALRHKERVDARDSASKYSN